MIWQLVKRDPMWKPFLGTMAIVFAFFLAGLGRDLLHTSVFGFVPAMLMIQMILIHLGVLSQRALYEAALPIDARDLWCSRVLTLLAAIWVPVAVAIACGFPPLQTLQMAAICTVISLIVKCVRLGEIEKPGLLRNVPVRIAFVLLIPAQIVFLYMGRDRGIYWRPGIVILTLCAVASFAIFWWGWRRVPKTFQIAPLRSVANDHERESSSRNHSVVFRSIYTLRTSILTFSILGGLAVAPWSTSAVFLAIVHGLIRNKCRWLIAMPFSLRRLFAWIVLPQTVGIVAGCLAGTFLRDRPLSAKARLIEVVVALTFCYCVIFFGELPTWRRLSRFRVTKWGSRIVSAPLLFAIVAPLYVLRNPRTLDRLAEAASSELWQFVGLLTIPPIVAYWLAEKAFIEQENGEFQLGRVIESRLQ